MPSLGLVANVYNEINALPGWLETHLPYFDDVRVYHAGPQGARSDDGTMELLEKWRVPVTFGSIDEGFGVVRTKAVRTSPCDYVMILDADERFFRFVPVLTCSGESTPPSEVDWILQSYDFRGVNLPNWENVAKLGEKLYVEVAPQGYHQGSVLRELLHVGRPDAVVTSRRHWHDFSFHRPTQDWNVYPDWQARIVRNHESVYYSPGTAMHEQLCGANNLLRPAGCVLFFDHFHFTFKRMEQEQRRHDIAIYDAIHAGQVPPINV